MQELRPDLLNTQENAQQKQLENDTTIQIYTN